MSGHNKWSKIKHKKSALDAKKSQTFSKIIRLISVEAKKSGGEINSPSLRAAIEKAKVHNVPKDNIEKAIKKGVGGEDVKTESITYEAYGPGGSAIIIETLTDNRNKTSAEVKHSLSKQGLSLASIGSALWAFEKQGSDWIPKTTIKLSDKDKEDLELVIENLEESEDVQEVYTNAE